MLRLEREEYAPLYRAHLDHLGIDAVLKILQDISDKHAGQDLVLLCFNDLAEPGRPVPPPDAGRLAPGESRDRSGGTRGRRSPPGESVLATSGPNRRPLWAAASFFLPAAPSVRGVGAQSTPLTSIHTTHPRRDRYRASSVVDDCAQRVRVCVNGCLFGAIGMREDGKGGRKRLWMQKSAWELATVRSSVLVRRLS